MNHHRAFIGLGANLDQPRQQLCRAVAALASHPQLELLAVSRLYGSAPIGPADQPDYLNAAALISTPLPPHALLAALQAIENAQGRVRERHWGPRTLDLDLLLFGRDEIHTPDLAVPHPELKNRAFVIRPLLDIVPDLTLPEGLRLDTLLPSLADQDIHPLADGDWWRVVDETPPQP